MLWHFGVALARVLCVPTVVFSLLLLCSAPVWSTNNLLVTGDDYPPMTGQSLRNYGLASDIVLRVFEEMGRPADLVFKPWKRGYVETLSGRYLGTFPYGKSDQRLKLFHYSQPLYRFGQYFFARNDSDISYREERDIQGLRVCLPQGYNPTLLQKLADNGTIRLARPSSMDACFRMLEKKRADLVRVNDHVGWSIVDKIYGSRDSFRMLEKPVRESVEHFIVPRSRADSEQLIEQFNRAQRKLQDAGIIDSVIAEHLQ